MLAADLTDKPEVKELFRKHEVHKQNQVDSSSQKDLPIQYNVNLNVSHFSNIHNLLKFACVIDWEFFCGFCVAIVRCWPRRSWCL